MLPEKLHLIVLEGGGDTEIKLVDQETIDWINSPPPTFFKSGAYDASVPPAVQFRAWDSMDESFKKNHPDPTAYIPYVTKGSYPNDRALWVTPLVVNGEPIYFYDIAEATNWFVEQGVTVTSSWEGYIY